MSLQPLISARRHGALSAGLHLKAAGGSMKAPASTGSPIFACLGPGLEPDVLVWFDDRFWAWKSGSGHRGIRGWTTPHRFDAPPAIEAVVRPPSLSLRTEPPAYRKGLSRACQIAALGWLPFRGPAMYRIDADKSRWFMIHVLPHEPALRGWLSRRSAGSSLTSKPPRQCSTSEPLDAHDALPVFAATVARGRNPEQGRPAPTPLLHGPRPLRTYKTSLACAVASRSGCLGR